MPARVTPRLNRPPALGLLAAAELPVTGSDTEDVDGTAVRWIDGFTFEPDFCSAGVRYAKSSTAMPTPDTRDAGVDYTPYIVEGNYKQSLFGLGDAALRAEVQAKAERALLCCEQTQIESELWTGSIVPGNLHLTSNTVTLIEGDRVIGYVTALAQLERFGLADRCGQSYMIHARPDTVTFWVQNGLVKRVGNLLVTELGTIVVAGAGYDGSAPEAGTVGLDPNHAEDAFSTDSAWAYVTGTVEVRRGAIQNAEPSEQTDPSTATHENVNTIRGRSSRFAAASFAPCIHGAVHVDHTVAVTVTGS